MPTDPLSLIVLDVDLVAEVSRLDARRRLAALATIDVNQQPAAAILRLNEASTRLNATLGIIGEESVGTVTDRRATQLMGTVAKDAMRVAAAALALSSVTGVKVARQQLLDAIVNDGVVN